MLATSPISRSVVRVCLRIPLSTRPPHLQAALPTRPLLSPRPKTTNPLHPENGMPKHTASPYLLHPLNARILKMASLPSITPGETWWLASSSIACVLSDRISRSQLKLFLAGTMVAPPGGPQSTTTPLNLLAIPSTHTYIHLPLLLLPTLDSADPPVFLPLHHLHPLLSKTRSS